MEPFLVCIQIVNMCRTEHRAQDYRTMINTDTVFVGPLILLSINIEIRL